jgi:hypothetical protein
MNSAPTAKQIYVELTKSNKKIRELIDSNALDTFVYYISSLQNRISKLYGILEKADKTGSIEEKVWRKTAEELYDIEVNVEKVDDAFRPNIKKIETVFKECQDNFFKVYKLCNRLNDNLRSMKKI